MIAYLVEWADEDGPGEHQIDLRTDLREVTGWLRDVLTDRHYSGTGPRFIHIHQYDSERAEVTRLGVEYIGSSDAGDDWTDYEYRLTACGQDAPLATFTVRIDGRA